jgi:hypothetical protein
MMRYCPVSKVGSIEAPLTINGCAIKKRKGMTMISARMENLKISTIKLSSFSGAGWVCCTSTEGTACGG